MFIYMIINDANGKYYIGKTVEKNLQKYLCWQLRYAELGQKTKPYLYNAIRKYSSENFRIEALMSGLATDEELYEWERALVNLMDSRNPQIGYNIAQGGRGAQKGNKNCVGRKYSEETKQRLRAAALRYFAAHPEKCPKCGKQKQPARFWRYVGAGC